MREHFVMTASGTDRLGVVERFASAILEHEGNIEASRMARLGGEFAMLLLVSVPTENVAPLRERLESFDFAVQTRPAELKEVTADSRATPYGITVTGADHIGIIYELARHLAERGVNIETMNTEVMAAPMSGAPLFTMSAVVVAPPGLGADDLRQTLKRLGELLGVDAAVLANR